MKNAIPLPKFAKQFVVRKAITTSLRASFKVAAALPLPLRVLRESMERSSGLFPVRPDVKVLNASLGGVDALRLLPPSGDGEQVVLHLHGGAFFGGSPKTHQSLCAEISARAQCPVYVLDYRLAPENPYPAAIDDSLAAYRALLDEGFEGQQIILAGDSAGGALILALAVKIRDSGLPMPGALVMLSPFLDLSVSSHSVKHLAHHDPMLTQTVLQRGGDAYRGTLAANDARVSPVFADLYGLPPTLVQCGSEEILLDDALLFQKLASQSGVEVQCKVFPDMWHNFQMFSQVLSTASDALDEIAQFIRANGRPV